MKNYNDWWQDQSNGHKLKYKMFLLNIRKHFFILRVLIPGTGCTGRLWVYLWPWRYSKAIRAWSWSSSRWPCLGWEAGLKDLQRSPPTSSTLWFCNTCQVDLDYLTQVYAVITSLPNITKQFFTMILQRKGAYSHSREVD